MIKKIINLGALNTLSQGFYRLSVFLVYMFSTTGNIKEFTINSTLITFLVVFQSFGVSGLSLAANTYISKYREKENIYAKTIIDLSLLISLIVSILFFFSINLILSKVFNNIGNANVDYRFLTFFIFILCFGCVLKGFYYAKEKIKYLVIASFLSAASLLSSYFLFNIELLASYLISIFFDFICLVLFLFKVLNVKKVLQTQVSISFYKELLRFIVPASASGIVLTPVNIVIIYILGFLDSVEIVSVFNYGMQIRNLIIFIPSMLGSVFLKLLSETNSGKNDFFIMALINFVISLGGSLFLITLKVFKFQYLDLISFGDLVILCISCILFSINSVVGNKIISLLQTKIGFYVNMIWAISFILFTYYFAIIVNLPSPFWGMLCAYMILTTIQFLYIRKVFK